MALASANALPRSAVTHVLRSIDRIVLPIGYCLSIPSGKFIKRAFSGSIQRMQTVYETRRVRLEMLIKSHGGKLANLNEALGYERNHTQLARIRNNNARTDRPGKTFVMGDPQAREIEQKLGLPLGWMDTPPTYAELRGEEDPRAKALAVFEALPADQWPTALRLIGALAQPEKKQGNGG